MLCPQSSRKGPEAELLPSGNRHPHWARLQLLCQKGGLGGMEPFLSQPYSPKDLGFTQEPSPLSLLQVNQPATRSNPRGPGGWSGSRWHLYATWCIICGILMYLHGIWYVP